VFTGSGAQVEFFTVNGTQLLQSRVPRLMGISSNVRGIFFNVFGSTSGMYRMDMDDFRAYQSITLWNFVEATNLTLQYTGVQGSLLAPLATVRNSEGVIWGQMLINEHHGNMQMNVPAFNGCIPITDCNEPCPGVGCRANETRCEDVPSGNECSYFVCNPIVGKRQAPTARAEVIPNECLEVARIFGTPCDFQSGCARGACSFSGLCAPNPSANCSATTTQPPTTTSATTTTPPPTNTTSATTTTPPPPQPIASQGSSKKAFAFVMNVASSSSFHTY
jgi:hypothetical protein